MSLLYVSTLAATGLEIAVLGFAAVFLVALILSICLTIYYFPVMKMLAKKQKELPLTESIESVSVTDNNYVSNNDELIAVISAAVAAYLSDTSVEAVPQIKADTKFKVVSFRKVR